MRNQIDPSASALAYAVGIGNAFYLLFSTTQYDPVRDTIIQHDLNPVLFLIDKTLQYNRKRNMTIFLLSATSQPIPRQQQKENYRIRRDPTAAINCGVSFPTYVMAYFSTSEHLYDLHNRSGNLWTLVSRFRISGNLIRRHHHSGYVDSKRGM